jgi:hypothetical protein
MGWTFMETPDGLCFVFRLRACFAFSVLRFRLTLIERMSAVSTCVD